LGSLVTKTADDEDALQELVAATYHDPLAFVLAMYPWGEPGGPLEAYSGPDAWQIEFLTRLGDEVKARAFDGVHAVLPIRMAVSSGHGIGKSTLVAWLVNWIMSTRPHARGSITANTFIQLETKTWAAIQTWTKRCLTRHWFTVTASQLYYTAQREQWFCTPISSEKEKSEAFAGQQAADSTSFYIFDEASAVPDIIWEVAEGGLAKGEPMIFVFGNPTRNSGKFFGAVFGDQRDRWISFTIDASTCTYANHALIGEWRHDYGEDSDFFRVRVKGLAPRAGDNQFIDSERIYAAQKRVVRPLEDEPLIAGVDVPDRGPAWFVCRFRRGADARSIPAIRLPGEASPDYRSKLIAILAEQLRNGIGGRKIAAMFVDAAFGSPIVERLRSLGFDNVHEIRFGGDSPNPQYENQRAYMWGKAKEWLPTGAIEPATTTAGIRLASDLAAPGYHLNRKDKIVLESKESMAKRNVASPDDGDALALTFAQPVAVAAAYTPEPYTPRSTWG
jgi:hypothetical protein